MNSMRSPEARQLRINKLKSRTKRDNGRIIRKLERQQRADLKSKSKD